MPDFFISYNIFVNEISSKSPSGIETAIAVIALQQWQKLIH